MGCERIWLLPPTADAFVVLERPLAATARPAFGIACGSF
jgi:hypothetical protein